MIDPDRMLEGLSRTLEQVVLPETASAYARGQLYAVLEVLASMQGQLLAGGPLLESEASTLASLVEHAAGIVAGDLAARCRSYSATSSHDLATRLAEGRAIVCALIEGGHADDGPLAEAVDSWLANDAILKAMALRPSRLAEISQG